MLRKTLFAVLIALVVVVIGPLSTMPRGAAPTPNVQVTTTIADLAADYPLRIQSDRQGAYITKTVNKVTVVQSQIVSNLQGSDWMLTTYATSRNQLVVSDRTVFFDLREQVSTGSFATPPVGTDTSGAFVEYGQATAHLIVKCSRVGVDMLTMANGATASCPGSFRFRALDGSWYRLSFEPANFPQVDRMQVTCTAADPKGCKLWTIAPGATTTTGTDPNAKSLNTLLLITVAR